MENKRLFDKSSILLVIIGFAINIGMANFALHFKIPVFLDAIGTILVSALGGFLPGAIAGLLYNSINAVNDPITLYYGCISIMIAFATSVFSNNGWFNKLYKTLLAGSILGFLCGGFGSLITWMLYGLDIGQGISSKYANYLYQKIGMSKFLSQLTADLGVDIIDKLISVIICFILLKLLSDKVLTIFKNGSYFLSKEGLEKVNRDENHTKLRTSIRKKIAVIIILTSTIVAVISISIGYFLYINKIENGFRDTAESAVKLASKCINSEHIDDYLIGELHDGEYEATEAKLNIVKDNFRNVKYLYVYKIEKDGCHVVFDLDSEGLPGEKLGAVIEFDEDFKEYLPELLAGKNIEPVMSNGKYGELMSYYYPIKNRYGETNSYVAVDISISCINSDKYMYLMRIITLLLGATIIILSFVIWFVDEQITNPINRLTQAAKRIAFGDDDGRKNAIYQMETLTVNTHDEIEELFKSFSRTTAELVSYVGVLEKLSEDTARQSEDILNLQDNIILSFSKLAENRDEDTGEHILRTAAYVREIAIGLSQNEKYSDILTPQYIKNLERSAPLHDVGKIRIPDNILNKPGKLTSEEFQIMKKHTIYGRDILQEVFLGVDKENHLSEAIDFAMYHHEKWNGTGYPMGLSGTDIPLCARIMAVADVFDALISKRCYKDAFEFDKAVEIIVSESGSHFDPDIVEVFVKNLDKLKKISLG